MMKKNKILIIGSGRLGASIASLLSSKGENIMIIDKNAASYRKLADSFSGYTIVGDATDQYILEDEASITEVKEIYITTNSDNTNLFIAHVCFYVYDVPEIYVRFLDTDKAKLIEYTTIRAIYPSKLSITDLLEKRNGGSKT